MSSGRLSMLVFNAQHASPERARRQAAWLAEEPQADLLVLTEVGPGPGGDVLINELTVLGYAHWHALPASGRDFRTLLASRETTLEPVDPRIETLPHRGPAAILQSDSHARLGIWGLYVPSRGPRERRNEDKRAFQQAVTEALPGLLKQFGDACVVVAGDLNVIEPNHVPAHRVFGRWEYDFYEAFGRSGLTDVFSTMTPQERGHSWYGRTGNGFRFDHAFTNVPGRVLTRAYDHAPRDLGISDHACLRLGLDLTEHPSR
ncbi:endonuclease/exonuclease/phosphatase family protein [Streptomyces sp. NPDC050508]|uniref:endonuclease/exonuclease/phosphatase family protein n=1 Tax=Streptomyces sp. NPDC050508 TaxID=3155405 RepID=UPI003419D34E